MAHYAKPLSFLLLMVLSLKHIDARESRFFSKVTHSSSNIVSVSESPLLAPAPSPASPAPAPASPAPFISENGYGLYGHGSSETTTTPTTTTTTTTTTTIANDENEIPSTEELNNLGSYKETTTGYSNNNYNNNGYSNYNNNGYTTNSYGTNNGYESEKQGMSDTRFVENGSYGTNNGYESEKQGMSDTRFVENGKYYYDVQNENYYHNGYESVKESGNNEGYYGNGQNSMNSNEFNTMEEYERQQGYPESQGEYVP